MSENDRLTGLVGFSGMKVPVRVATTAAITLSGLQTIDGVTVVADDRVLVKNQSSSVDNGIYVADTGTWERAKDADGPYDFVNGTLVPVAAGSTYGGYVFKTAGTDPIDPGTDAMTFSQGLFSGLSGVTFLQAGTGAVSRAAQDKMREVVSLEDFGCVGDGTTDDTTAFQAAITAVQGTNVELWAPPGTYKVTNGGLAATGALRLRGAGRYASSITWTSTTADLLTITTPNECAIEALRFSGPASATAGAMLTFTASGSAENAFSIVRDVTFSQGYNHIVTAKASSFTVDNCYFTAYVNFGINVVNTNNVDSGDSTICNSTFSNGGASSIAIRQASSGGLRVTNNKLLGGAYGYRMVLASAAATGVLLIEGNSMENQTTAAMDFTTSGGGATFAGVVINGNHVNNVPVCVNMADATAFLSRITIADNHFCLTAAGGTAVVLTNVSDFYVGGGTITGTGGTTFGVSVGSSSTLGKIGPIKTTALTTNYDISGSSVTIEGPPSTLLASSGTAVAAPADTNENALATITIPAKQLGKNGSIRVRANLTITNSANNKTIRFRYSAIGGTAMFSTVLTTNGKLVLDFVMRNANATNSQIAHAIALTDTPGVLAPADVTASVDTTADTTLVITGQKASAGETIQLQGYTCELIPSRT